MWEASLGNLWWVISQCGKRLCEVKLIFAKRKAEKCRQEREGNRFDGLCKRPSRLRFCCRRRGKRCDLVRSLYARFTPSRNIIYIFNFFMQIPVKKNFLQSNRRINFSLRNLTHFHRFYSRGNEENWILSSKALRRKEKTSTKRQQCFVPFFITSEEKEKWKFANAIRVMNKSIFKHFFRAERERGAKMFHFSFFALTL